MASKTSSLLLLVTLLAASGTPLLAQRNRITSPITNSARVSLAGHVHPKARPEYDQGKVDGSLVLPYVTLLLSHTADQQTALDQLLVQQQDPASPNYHRWLSPDEFADRFGASQDDINKITSWLQSQNLAVKAVGRSRNWISFSGTAAQMQQAFAVEIHNYDIDGEVHYANANEPLIPAALSGIVKSVRGLHNFRMRS